MVQRSPEADVIVLGGGLAGCCAGLSALEAGASVLLIEKAEPGAGSTWQSAGTFAFAGTALQREAGYEDDGGQLAEELVKIGGGHNDPALIARFASDQLETYEWLARQGVVFERVQLSGGQAVPRSHATNPAQLMQALQDKLGAHPRFRRIDKHGAERLRNHVVGWSVICGVDEHDAPAMVIATGGFSRSLSLIQTFAPTLAAGTPLGGLANTGDGLRMAMALGCGLADMGYVKGTFGMPLAQYPAPTLGAPEGIFLLMPIYRGGIAVNRAAKRFTDESRSYKEIGTACLRQPEGIAFQIFDAPIMAQSMQFPANMNFAGGLARGLIRKADTIAQLAQSMGLDPAALNATMAHYNQSAAAGRDAQFGRDSIAGGVGKPVPISEPPFYILPCGVAVTGTFCGIRIDEDARVLDVFGVPLGGLYAAGEVTGGFHGESYMSGSALAKAALFGRIAGASAAARA